MAYLAIVFAVPSTVQLKDLRAAVTDRETFYRRRLMGRVFRNWRLVSQTDRRRRIVHKVCDRGAAGSCFSLSFSVLNIFVNSLLTAC